MRILSTEDMQDCLSMREAIEIVKSAFRQLSTGGAVVPLRTHLSLPAGDTFVMPAWLRTSNALGVKLVSLRLDNATRGLPVVPGIVLLLDAETGMPSAVLDGTYLTKLRTGAAVGAATDLLARKEAKRLSMIGAGALAPFCIEAALLVRNVSSIRIYSRTAKRVDELVSWCRRHFPEVEAVACASASEAVHDADIITCATTSQRPVFSGNDLKPGAHVNGIGSYRPDMQEVDEATVRRAKVVVDSREACLKEAGDLIYALTPDPSPTGRGEWGEGFRHIHAELGEIVAGTKPGRESPEEITFFKSVGNAVQDIAVAAAICSNGAETVRARSVSE